MNKESKKSSSLPEWIEQHRGQVVCMANPCLRDCRMFEAISIAWEALEKVAENNSHIFWESREMEHMQHSDNCPVCTNKDALRRIRELGEK